LNGQGLHNYFKQNSLDKHGIYQPFNEAMCIGEVAEDIFSSEFNKYRCAAHQITINQYNEVVLKPLQMLFENQCTHIILWFDEDMFCQINLLTILGYLDQIKYHRRITFNLISRHFKKETMVLDSFELQAKGYKEIYKQVMINRSSPENINLAVMKNGINLYFQYLKDENEITEYIRQNANLNSDILLSELFKTFPQYGLGDTQYKQLIERHKRSI
jgi:hypothetical protein